MSSHSSPEPSKPTHPEPIVYQSTSPQQLDTQYLAKKLEAHQAAQGAANGVEDDVEQSDNRKKANGDHADTNANCKIANGTEETQKPCSPSTPPSQMIRALYEKQSDSPDSQVIASGDCSPGSEGVKRADRKDVHHWPGAQECCEKAFGSGIHVDSEAP